jgi:hypothetical protein
VWLVREAEWVSAGLPAVSMPFPLSLPFLLLLLPPRSFKERSRIIDQTVSGDHGVLSPVIGVMQALVMSLMEAAVATQVPHMDESAYIANEIGSERSRNDPYGLTTDEASTLTLYTMDGELYRTINQLLCDRNRHVLKPFFPYMRLLLTARNKLPPFTGMRCSCSLAPNG